jgi:hypothetical protein
MKCFPTLPTLALLAISVSTLAAEARIGALVLSIPPQFKGPISAVPAEHTSTIAYGVSSSPGTPGTVLQVTRLEGGRPPPNLSEADATRLRSQYLLEMLSGIERARTEFSRSSPQSIRLGGLMASKVTWKGALRGMPVNGVMYCMVVGPDLVWIHAFGPGNKPDASTSQAIAAIETLTVSADK